MLKARFAPHHTHLARPAERQCSPRHHHPTHSGELAYYKEDDLKNALNIIPLHNASVAEKGSDGFTVSANKVRPPHFRHSLFNCFFSSSLFVALLTRSPPRRPTLAVLCLSCADCGRQRGHEVCPDIFHQADLRASSSQQPILIPCSSFPSRSPVPHSSPLPSPYHSKCN